MSEDASYTPGEWSGHTFAEAKKAYTRETRTKVVEAVTRGVAASDLLPAKISTQSFAPVIVLCDVTGSFGSWPATIFSKLPYLDLEGQQYMGKDMEISFAAVGDHYSDKYPLQVRPFAQGIQLKEQLDKLLVEGGGGSNAHEDYLLAALYYLHNAEMPNAAMNPRKPLLIFIADEPIEAFTDPKPALQYAKVTLQGRVSAEEVFRALREKYEVYLIYKRHSDFSRRQWAGLLGEDHVADLQDPERVVDVIFGIMAAHVGKVAYFRGEIEDRQEAHTPAGGKKVATVYEALKTIHAPSTTEGKSAADLGGKSTLHRPSGGTKTRGLLEG